MNSPNPIWHTVLVTSALFSNYGIYDPKQRIAQTISTVNSVKKYLPNSTIILIDNSTTAISSANDSESELLDQLEELVDYWIDNSDDTDIQHFHANVQNYDVGKNSMEALGFHKALTHISEDPEIMELINNSNRIFKLSGRYELTNKFDVDTFNNKNTIGKYVFKVAQPSWIDPADTGVTKLYQTRLWSFTPDLYKETIELFALILKNMFDTYNANKYIDMEHSMAKFLPAEQLVEVPVVGLKGNIAPNGMIVVD